MKNILLIPVGGTICTEKSDKGTLSINENAEALILDTLWRADAGYKEKVHFTVTENLGILSESMTVDKWNRMLGTYREYIKRERYDGVIFAHGTDTLAYSAALFSFILCDAPVPVFFVSSNARLSSPRANGGENFRFAVDSILAGISPNIYVPYKNISDQEMYLHLASRLKQCAPYSEDFESEGMLRQEKKGEAYEVMQDPFPGCKKTPLFESLGKWQLKNTVLKLTPYVGLDYDAIAFESFRAVLHTTYHSGTVSADRAAENGNFSRYSVLHILSKTNHTDIYLSPAKKEGEIYDSVREIYENGEKIRFLYGMTEEAAYAKLLLAYSVYESPEKRQKCINTECNFEYCY